MSKPDGRCVLLANPNHNMSEGIRGLLATMFDVIVAVADERSLLEAAHRLGAELAVIDLSLPRGDALGLIRHLRERFPKIKMIIISTHAQSSLSRAVLDAGADGFVAKHVIATDLLEAADAVLSGTRYASAYVAPLPV